jgi:hypothetical protein
MQYGFAVAGLVANGELTAREPACIGSGGLRTDDPSPSATLRNALLPPTARLLFREP